MAARHEELDGNETPPDEARDTVRIVGAGVEASEGGDPVCWLEQVCPTCGGLEDGPPADVCPRCGAPRSAQG